MDEFTQMSERLTQVVERLARIETKLDHVSEKFDSHDVKLVDHETRIRKLERAIWIASGTALAGGGALGATLSNIIGV